MRQTGNQQVKVSDNEIGWLAGFFDGEGSVGFNVFPRAGKQWPRIDPRCLLTATDIESCRKADSILTNAGVGHHVAWRETNGFRADGSQYKRRWTITIMGLKRNLAFLTLITPYLATKQRKAELLFDYIRLRFAQTDAKCPPSDDEVMIVNEVRRLNRKAEIVMPDDRHEIYHMQRVRAGEASWTSRSLKRMSDANLNDPMPGRSDHDRKVESALT